MDAEQRPLRIADDLRRELGEADVHLLDERRERLAHVALVRVATRLEPLARIVAPERREEAHRRRREAVELGCTHDARSASTGNASPVTRQSFQPSTVCAPSER